MEMLLVHSRWNHPPLEFGSSFDVKMPKERNFNPVQAQRKADKAKAIKKGTPLMPVHGREATDSQPQERQRSRLAATSAWPSATPSGSASRSMTSRQ